MGVCQMPRLTASMWIDASPEQVFAICEAPPGPLLPPEGPKLILPDKPGLVGSNYCWELRRWGYQHRFGGVVTECDPGRRLAMRSDEGWKMEAELCTSPEKSGTRLFFRVNYRFPAPIRWVIPTELIRRGVWHGLHQVKVASEKRAGHRVTPTSAP